MVGFNYGKVIKKNMCTEIDNLYLFINLLIVRLCLLSRNVVCWILGVFCFMKAS